MGDSRSCKESIKGLAQRPRFGRCFSQAPRWRRRRGRGVGENLGGQGVETEPVRGDGMRDGLGAHPEHGQVEVGHVVTGAVVVDVVRNACLPAEESLLGIRLDHLSAREEPARGDPRVQKGPVVGSAVEVRRHERLLGLVFEVIFKQAFGLGGAGGARDVEGRSVPVVDTVDVIG